MAEGQKTEHEPAARISVSPVIVDSESTLTADTAADKSDRNGESQYHASDPRSSTIACCKACSSQFGSFYNSWIRITGSYFLPSRVESPESCTGLHPKTKPKPASEGSSLSGCLIQPLVCNNCEDTLGITCIKAPEGKLAYANRQFYKLPKIQLRDGATGSPVDAVEDNQQERDSSLGATSTMDRSSEVSVATMQKPPLPSLPVQGHKSPQDSRRHEFAAAPGRPVPSHQPPQQPQQKPAMHDRDSLMAPQNRHNDRVVPLGSSVNGLVQTNGPTGSISYPSNLAVKLDAIDRIQTQVNLNRATLESCTRDISRLESSFRILHSEFKETVEAFRMELLASRQHAAAAAAAAAPQGDRLDDQTLEVFSSTLSEVVTKTNEVGVLKMDFEIIKRKIKRLEEGNPGPAPVAPNYVAHRRESSMHQTPVAQHQPQGPVHHISPTTHHPESRSLGSSYPSQTQHSAYTPEPSRQSLHQDPDSAAAAAAGWVSVNTTAGAKRGHPNGIEGRANAAGTPVGSPKRPKLAPIEPRFTYEASTAPGTGRLERTDTDESNPSRGYRTESNESYPDSTDPSTFIPYSTQEAPADDSWRPVSQRAVSNPAPAAQSPRGRGRGRGGRPRKSLPVQPHIMATPEWEKEGWTGSQVEQDGYYRGSIIRRGSGGALSGGPSPPGSTVDPYGHTKKSRTRPIRNADGVLIRKDGRPDMRSQSSAANLRKVHAKKEEERLSGGPTSSLAGEPMMIGSPTSTESHDAEISGTQERAQHIMKQMFPHGIDEERGRLYTAQQYFPPERSPSERKTSIAMKRTVSESERNADSIEPSKSPSTQPKDHDEVMEDQQLIEKATSASVTETQSHSIGNSAAPASVPPPPTTQAPAPTAPRTAIESA